MELTLCIPAWRRYDLLERAIDSAMRGRRTPDRILIVDNGGNLAADRPACAADRLQLVRPLMNLGVAGAWNYFLCHAGTEGIVLCNDDVVLGANAIEALEAAAETHPDHLSYHCVDENDYNSWCLFLQRTRAAAVVGLYDTSFWPAYFEDNDYDYRQNLLGYRCRPIPECEYEHQVSASKLTMTPQELRRAEALFAKNARYYREKWGGPPGAEMNRIPFGAVGA